MTLDCSLAHLNKIMLIELMKRSSSLLVGNVVGIAVGISEGTDVG